MTILAFFWGVNAFPETPSHPTGWGPQSSSRSVAYIISGWLESMVYGRYNELVFMGGYFLWFLNHFPIFPIDFP